MPITRRRARLALLLAAFALPAVAQELSLPSGATMTREVSRDPGAYDLPVGPWTLDGGLPVRRVEGPVTARAFRIDGSGLTPLQLLAPLRDQLTAAGFETVLDCTDRACGGFDFRFSTYVLPAPGMYVDLTDYQFLSALSANGAAVSVLASRDTNAGYVQIVRVGAGAQRATRTDAAPVLTGPSLSVAERLESEGHTVLTDLVFDTGSASLGDGAVGSLDAIAAYLKAYPSRVVLFVGHTDATGSLEANKTVSRRRAQAAVDYLSRRHGIGGGQISAEGAGYLAPVASNLTAEGREANRRVEAVLLSTE